MNTAVRRNFSVYLLELTDGYYYVGTAPDVVERYAKHVAGTGAEFTRLHPPLRLIQTREFSTLTEAMIGEDAAVLWLMIKHGKDRVRGGRWFKEGHKDVYGYSEGRRVLDDASLSKEEKWSRLVDLVKWTIPTSWYWEDLTEGRRGLKKKLKQLGAGQMPAWLPAEREALIARHDAERQMRIQPRLAAIQRVQREG